MYQITEGTKCEYVKIKHTQKKHSTHTVLAYSIAAGVADSGTVLTRSTSAGHSLASSLPHLLRTDDTVWPAIEDCYLYH